MKIVGNGMIARAFGDSGAQQDDLLVLASGVSNSHETSTEQFRREADLLSDELMHHAGMKVVYFSSCSVGLVDSPYYRHKSAMEKIVMEGAERFLVCRLPQAVGVTRNATLVNHIAKCIRSGKLVGVRENARRNLIDIDDVVRIVLRLSKLPSMRIQITNGRMMPIAHIVSAVSNALGLPVQQSVDSSEIEDYVYDGSELMSLLGPGDPIYSRDYEARLLSKYADRLGY
jgi:nucleoside-diphosphate-sugar epimerase